MDVGDIIREYLKNNNYDGLYSSGICACFIDDLVPCGEACDQCEAGYRIPCPYDGDCECEGEGDHISSKNPNDHKIRTTLMEEK